MKPQPCNFLQSNISSSRVVPNILLIPLLSNTFSLYISPYNVETRFTPVDHKR